MYPNLNAEMARKDMTVMELSEITGIPYQRLNHRLRGKSELSVYEAFLIHAAFCEEFTFEYLFQRKK